jgi:hypothetical protein
MNAPWQFNRFGCAEKHWPVSPADAKAIARDAYIFAMPVIYFQQQQHILTNVPKPTGALAPYKPVCLLS